MEAASARIRHKSGPITPALPRGHDRRRRTAGLHCLRAPLARLRAHGAVSRPGQAACHGDAASSGVGAGMPTRGLAAAPSAGGDPIKRGERRLLAT